MVNMSRSLLDIFSFRHLILGFLLLEVLFLTSQDFFDLSYFFSQLTIGGNAAQNSAEALPFVEANSFIDWSKLLQRTDHLRSLGGILYTEYKITLILAAILLFLSRVGAISVTLFLTTGASSKGFFVKKVSSLKLQDFSSQSLSSREVYLRHPNL